MCRTQGRHLREPLKKPIVISLPASNALATQLALAIEAEFVELSVHRFPDGETVVRIDADVENRCVILAGSLDHVDEKTLPLVFAADAARDLGATQVLLVAPYLAYLRQDKRFRAGEAVTSRTYAKLISLFVDGLITVDPHLHRYRALDELYRIRTGIVASSPSIAEWVRANVVNPLLIGPDRESEQWVAAVALAANAPYTILQKVRRGDHDVTVSLPDLSAWSGKVPVLVDDIISSGNTLFQAAASLRRAGMVPPVCIGVHALFAQDAYQRLLDSGVECVVTCDTVAHPSNAITLIEPLAGVLRKFLVNAVVK